MALSPSTTSVAKPTVYVLLPSPAFASLTVMFLPLVTVVFAAVALLLTSFNCSSVAARPDVAKPAYFVVLLVRPLIVAVPPPPLTRTLPIRAIEPLIVVWLPIPPSTVISAPLILVSLVTPFLAWITVAPVPSAAYAGTTPLPKAVIPQSASTVKVTFKLEDLPFDALCLPDFELISSDPTT